MGGAIDRCIILSVCIFSSMIFNLECVLEVIGVQVFILLLIGLKADDMLAKELSFSHLVFIGQQPE